jgi:HD-like signal output (HDOD) protein
VSAQQFRVFAANEAPIDGKSILHQLAQRTDLPTPAGIAMRIIELGREPDVSLSEIADVISLDPALSAKLMRIANSPLYGRPRKTGNLRQAVTLLGIEGAMALALGFSIIGNLREENLHGLDFHLFWRRSLAAATCAQLLAERLLPSAREDLFLAGLLQDIGMLALARARPDLYEGIGSQPKSKIREHERAVLGTDHAEVGGWLLEQWRFPEETRAIVLWSHEIQSLSVDDGSSFDLSARIVGIGAEMAELWCGVTSLAFLLKLMHRARTLLCVSDDVFVEVLDSARERMSESAPLFEVDLDDPMNLEMVIDEARELTMLRQLKMAQKTS